MIEERRDQRDKTDRREDEVSGKQNKDGMGERETRARRHNNNIARVSVSARDH